MFHRHTKAGTICRPVSGGMIPAVLLFHYFFLRLSALGYDFDAAWVKKAHIGLLRVELSGNDLFRAATVRAERGLDYPYSRSFAASVKMSF